MPSSPSSFSSVVLPLLVLLLLLLAGPQWLWWVRGCCVVEVVVEGAGHTAVPVAVSHDPFNCGKGPWYVGARETARDPM